MTGYPMKNDLAHLPEGKRRAIDAVAHVITAFECIELLILFGSYARGDYVDDPLGRDGDGKFPYHSDLDICVIVKSPRQKRRIERSSQLREQLRAASDIRVSFIVHTIRQFNRALENGEYFYVDVVKDGVMLFDAGTSTLSKPKNLSPEKRQAKAKEDYAFWTQKAGEFLKGYEFYRRENSLAMCAFHLHQTAENYLTAACLVLSGYRPPGHDLVVLENWCAQFDPDFNDALPKASEKDHRLLELLQAAYVGARYKKTFEVTPTDVAALERRILALKNLVESKAS